MPCNYIRVCGRDEKTQNPAVSAGFFKYIPQECLNELESDGISIIKANIKPNQYILDINAHINNRINNCKDIFPIWLKWEYIRAIFIMPDGLSENGIKRAANEYYENKSGYPYGVYINWPFTNKGNILYNDKKFVTLLYEANEDSFYDMSKISDAGNMTKAGIYRFLGDSERVVMMVDCENSDPYKLYATLNNLDQQALLAKISKIVLFDDVNTASAWSILEDFTEIPIEYILIERLKDNKSLVDIRLTASASREHYRDGVNDFILVSSDSDYWGLIVIDSFVYFAALLHIHPGQYLYCLCICVKPATYGILWREYIDKRKPGGYNYTKNKRVSFPFAPHSPGR